MNIDVFMNLYKRHLFETLCKSISTILQDRDFEIASKYGKKFILYTNKKILWKQVSDDAEYFFNPNFLNNLIISQKRALNHLYGWCMCYVIARFWRIT